MCPAPCLSVRSLGYIVGASPLMCPSVYLVTLWVRPDLFCVSVRSFGDILGASPLRRKLGKILYMKDDLRIAGIHTGGCIHSPRLPTNVPFLVTEYGVKMAPKRVYLFILTFLLFLKAN